MANRFRAIPFWFKKAKVRNRGSLRHAVALIYDNSGGGREAPRYIWRQRRSARLDPMDAMVSRKLALFRGLSQSIQRGRYDQTSRKSLLQRQLADERYVETRHEHEHSTRNQYRVQGHVQSVDVVE